MEIAHKNESYEQMAARFDATAREFADRFEAQFGNDWQPIDTLPTHLDVFRVWSTSLFDCLAQHHAGKIWGCDTGGRYIDDATHWRPYTRPAGIS